MLSYYQNSFADSLIDQYPSISSFQETFCSIVTPELQAPCEGIPWIPDTVNR